MKISALPSKARGLPGRNTWKKKVISRWKCKSASISTSPPPLAPAELPSSSVTMGFGISGNKEPRQKSERESIPTARNRISSSMSVPTAEDINLPIGVPWDHFSNLAFKQSSSIKTLSPHLDEDGDLASNFTEFVYGTDPFSRDSVSLPAYTFSKNQSGVEATMIFPLIRSVRGVGIQPETSITLNGPFSPQGSPFLPQDANAALQLATFTSGQLNDPKWFWHINVASSPAAPQ